MTLTKTERKAARTLRTIPASMLGIEARAVLARGRGWSRRELALGLIECLRRNRDLERQLKAASRDYSGIV